MLKEPLHSVIIGSLLGDGCLEKNGCMYRMRFDHSIKQVSYIKWKYNMIKEIAACEPKKIEVYDVRKNKKYWHVRFCTKSMKELKIYYEWFYFKAKKNVPKNIELLMNSELALAVWYMDDGHRRTDCKALRLNTQSFSTEEINLLIKVLDKNFGIKSKIHKAGKYNVIYIPSSSAKQFCNLIHRYIPPEMGYKLL